MGSLLGLFKLLRVSEQYYARGGRRWRENIGGRHLTGFVHEEHVDRTLRLVPGPEPWRGADHVSPTVGEPCERFGVVSNLLDGGRWNAFGCYFVDAADRKPRLASRQYHRVEKV